MDRPEEEASVYIGLGSNLGDRAEQIRFALALLHREAGVRVVRVSNLYQSAPQGYLEQPAFLNAVAELRTSLEAIELLRRMKAIEHRLGRQPAPRWGPRIIDLDILIYDNLRVTSGFLQVPHPLMSERAFVLAPLSELWPDYRLPNGLMVHEALEILAASQPVERYAEVGDWTSLGHKDKPSVH